MKTITIDYETYKAELANEHHKGYRKAINTAHMIVEEFNAGKTEERLISDYCEDQCEFDFVVALCGGKK